MDPNATLDHIDHYSKNPDFDHGEFCEYLQNWLSRGGFQPTWSKYPAGKAAYFAWCIANGKMPHIALGAS